MSSRLTGLLQALRQVEGRFADARLGVSMIRSMLTHGLLWTIVDAAGVWIETRPLERFAGKTELK